MNLRQEARWLRPIAAIIVIALVCAGYILNKQRLESPLRDLPTSIQRLAELFPATSR